MTEQNPTPRSTSKKMVANVLIILVIVILAPTLTIGAIWWQTGALPTFSGAQPPQIPPEGVLATVTLHPGSDEPVTTPNSYVGELVLVVEGSVPDVDTGLRDLFYTHTDEFSLPIESPVLVEPLLNINGVPIDPLPYNPFHVYQIPYNVESPAQPIPFSLNTAYTAPSDTRRIRVFVTQPDR